MKIVDEKIIEKIKNIEYVKIDCYNGDTTAVVYLDDINEYLKLINIYNLKVVFVRERIANILGEEGYFLFFDNSGIGHHIYENNEKSFNIYPI